MPSSKLVSLIDSFTCGLLGGDSVLLMLIFCTRSFSVEVPQKRLVSSFMSGETEAHGPCNLLTVIYVMFKSCDGPLQGEWEFYQSEQSLSCVTPTLSIMEDTVSFVIFLDKLSSPIPARPPFFLKRKCIFLSSNGRTFVIESIHLAFH